MNYRPLNEYQHLLFDCDGVILNSNQLKTEAFYKASLGWGADLSLQLKRYHIANGGVSRYKKFEYFLRCIVGQEVINDTDLSFLLSTYEQILEKELESCEVDTGIFELKRLSSKSTWHVVSGGDELELNSLFEKKAMSYLFEGGIHGSPRDKYQIIEDIDYISSQNNQTLFIGDSKYDYDVAMHYGLDFIFLTHWTEWAEWAEFFSDKNVICLNSIQELYKYDFQHHK